MKRHGEIAKGLRKEFERLVWKFGCSELIPVYKERGIFTFDFFCKPPSAPTEESESKDLAPVQQDGAAPSGGAGPSVFQRQAQ